MLDYTSQLINVLSQVKLEYFNSTNKTKLVKIILCVLSSDCEAVKKLALTNAETAYTKNVVEVNTRIL